MNYNQISWTIADMNGAFEGLSALTRLGLRGNRIRSISKEAFLGLDSLRQLNLLDNALSTVQSNAFALLPELSDL